LKQTTVVPLLLFVVIATLALFVWRLETYREIETLRLRTTLTASQVALRLSEFIDTRLKVAETISATWTHDAPPDEAGFQALANDVVHQFGGLLAINWIDTAGVIRWVAPPGPNAAAQGKSIAHHPIAGPYLAAARHTDRMQVSRPLDLYQGGLGFAAYIPLTTRTGEPAGYLNAVFRVAPLVERCLRNGLWPHYTYRIGYGGQEVYREPHYADTGIISGKESFPVGNHLWTVTLRPSSRLLAQRPISDEYFLATGLLLALVIALLLRQVLKRRQRARRAAQERVDLEHSMLHVQKLESLGVLAGGIAHDFNNLLHTISGNVELARDDIPPGSTIGECLDDIANASQHAADLCHQMLTYSGRGHAETRPVDVNELIEEMAPLLRASTSGKTTVHFQPGEDVPAIICSEAQMRQVVMNLVTNAAEASDESGAVTIRTGCQAFSPEHWTAPHNLDDLPAGEYVFIDVNDTGSGMNDEVLLHIFDPFYTTKFSGRGLGMATVLGIVRAHRGAITVRSTPGEGSRICVLMPADRTAIAQPSHEFTKAPDPARPNAGGTVLVVDDDDSVRVLVGRLLAVSGYGTVGAPDGQSALDILEARPSTFDCVLLDVTMPGMDGVAVLAEMRRRGIRVPVILSSGYTTTDITERFRDDPPAAFVGKPYQRATLLSAVDRAIRSSLADPR